MLNERECLVGVAEWISEVGRVGRLGSGDLVRGVGIAQPTRIEASFCLSIADTVALLFLSVLGTEVIFQSVECWLRQEDLKDCETTPS